MARFNEESTELIYVQAQSFSERCLVNDGSLFEESDEIWSLANLEKFETAFKDNPDESENSFLEKFEKQVQPAGPDICKLAAEIVAIHFLFPSNVGQGAKLRLVNNILSWGKHDPLDQQHEITQAFTSGIGGGGQGYNTRRPYELWFLTDICIAIKKLSTDERSKLLSDPWKFQEFIDKLEDADGPQIRHMLLHLLFPDDFERISSRNHKKRILSAFDGMINDPPKDEDQHLFQIRESLEKLFPKIKLDFYEEPLSKGWYDEYASLDDDSPMDVIDYKKQLVLFGPPGTGKSFRAHEVAQRIIQSAALRQFGAAKYFQELESIERSVSENTHILQLHPAYSYENFVVGLHFDGEKTEYRLGALPEIINSMNQQTSESGQRLPHVLILDEINRTDLSRMLGECFSLLENRNQEVDLPATKNCKPITLSLPKDLYIIGTMNLIDQSVEQIDFALRRRFLWLECRFNSAALLQVIRKKWNDDPAPYNGWENVEADFERLVLAATSLNKAICESPLLGPQFEIGHTYFFDVVPFLRSEQNGAKAARSKFLWGRRRPKPPIEQLWKLSLRPLLNQYLAGLSSDEQQSELSRLEEAFITRPELDT